MSNFIDNILIAVKYQIKLDPLVDTQQNNIERCRLCLYSMNSGFLSGFILSKIAEKGKEYVYDFHNTFI